MRACARQTGVDARQADVDEAVRFRLYYGYERKGGNVPVLQPGTGRRAVSVAALLAVAGCANLTAVSNFAKLGSDVTSSTAAMDTYPAAVQEQARMASPAELAARKTQAAGATDETRVADLGMKTLSLYLATLSQLADNTLIAVKPAASSIDASLKSLHAIKASIADPATSLITLLLTAPLDVWRREAVGNLIDRANQPVQSLGNALADFARATALIYDQDISSADIYYRNLGAKTNDAAVRELLDEWRLRQIADYAKARDQAKAAEVTLRKIVQAQAELQAHRNDLSSDALKALLTQYQDDIFKAAQLLPLHSAL